MKAFFKNAGSKLRRKLRSETAENTITMMIAFPLIWAVLMTILDFGVFMQDRTLLVSDLRDGARTVAIYGSSNSSSALAAAYGTGCVDRTSGGHAGASGDSDLVGCLVKNQIQGNRGYSQIVISNVKCGKSNPDDPTNPRSTSNKIKIGQAVSCAAHYRYEGFPGSALGLMGGNFMGAGAKNTAGGAGRAGDLQNVNYQIQKSGWNEGDVVVSAQSEVTLK